MYNHLQFAQPGKKVKHVLSRKFMTMYNPLYIEWGSSFQGSHVRNFVENSGYISHLSVAVRKYHNQKHL